MSDWTTFDDPRFELRFRYPTVTPGGDSVERQESEERGVLRVHVLSAGREVYFEVRRFPPMPARDEYRQHRPYLEQKFADLAITELSEARHGSWPAEEYSFRWGDGERTVLLLPAEAATYRVIYNPRAPLNHEILATLEIDARARRDDPAP